MLFPILCAIFGTVIENSSQENKLSQKEDTTITVNAPETVPQEVKQVQDDCIVKVGNLCFREPSKIGGGVPYLSYQECKAEANALGIKTCYAERDYWAGFVKECGGIENVPSVDDLFVLARHLYGQNVKRCLLPEEDNFNYGDKAVCEDDNYHLQVNENSPFYQWLQNKLFPYPPVSGYDEENRKTMWRVEMMTSNEKSPIVVHSVTFYPRGIHFLSQGKGDGREEAILRMCVSKQ